MYGYNLLIRKLFGSKNGQGSTNSPEPPLQDCSHLAKKVGDALKSDLPESPSPSPTSLLSPRSSSSSVSSSSFKSWGEAIKKAMRIREKFGQVKPPQDVSPSDANGTPTESTPPKEKCPEQGRPEIHSTKLSL